MKRSIKYSIITFFVFGIASARNEQCYDAGDIFVSCPQYMVDTQFRVLFAKPSASNLYYAAQAIPFNPLLATPIASPNWQIFDINPHYRFGFDLAARVIIPARGTNLGVNWEHFSSSSCSMHTVNNPNDMVGPFSSIGPDASPYKQAHGRARFAFNEVNINYGQYVNFGDYLATNLFFGITVAKLKQNLTAVFNDPGIFISRTTKTPSVFKGAGPGCGVELTYQLCDLFYLTGLFSGALLMGKTENHTTYASTTPALEAIGNPSPNIQSTCQGKRTSMVPDFGQRIGIACHFNLFETAGSKVEFGWENKILLNAIQTNDIGSGVINTPPYTNTIGVFARTFHRTLSNFSFGAPYLAFNLTF